MPKFARGNAQSGKSRNNAAERVKDVCDSTGLDLSLEPSTEKPADQAKLLYVHVVVSGGYSDGSVVTKSYKGTGAGLVLSAGVKADKRAKTGAAFNGKTRLTVQAWDGGDSFEDLDG